MKLRELNLKEQVAEAMQRVYASGLTTTSGGNISACDEEGVVFITPSGIDKGSLTPDDIAVVAPGKKVSGKYAPSMELPFHGDVYRACKDVKAIVHAHSPAIVAYACMHKAPSSEYAGVYGEILGETISSEYALPGSKELGKIVEAKFREGYRTVMMENHGATVGAKDLGTALSMYETLDFLTQALFYAEVLGGARLPGKKIKPSVTRYEVSDSLPDDPEICRTIVSFVRRAYAGKLTGNGFGTLAVRTDDCVYFNADGTAPADLTESDIVRYSDGKASVSFKCRYLELILKVFDRNPEAKAVFVSAPAATMGFALAHKKFDAKLIPESYIMLRDVTRLEHSVMEDYGRVAEALSVSAPVAIIDNECAIAIGKNATKAFDRLEVLDYSARSVIMTRSVAEVTPISYESVKEINAVFDGW